MTHAPDKTKAHKRSKWRRKNDRVKHDRHFLVRRNEKEKSSMSKTHTGEITAQAKKIAKWLSVRIQSKGAVAPTTHEITTRIHQACPCPRFSSEDQVSIGRAALTLFKRDNPAGWQTFCNQNPDVEDRKAAE